MIKTTLFVFGIIFVLLSGGYFALTIAGASMSDNPQAANEAVGDVLWSCGIGGVIGIAMIVGACFL